MKKIIFFSKNLNIGGMEKALIILLNNLQKTYDVTLVLEEKKGILLNKLNNKINVQEYKVCKSTNILYRKFKNLTKRLIWSIKNANKYDFSCNYATYSIIGSKLAHIASKNSAFYIHSDYYNVFAKDMNKIKNFFSYHDLEKFQKMIFVSNESQMNFLKVYPEYKDKCEVINNLIDYENILKLSKQKISINLKTSDKNFAFIGRLDNDSKNLKLLINSFKIAIAKNSRIKLFIIGNGMYKETIKQLINDNQLNNNITLVNETKNPYPYLKQVDALILTSNYEGFPVVYLEALVLNKPILSTIMTSDESIDIRDYGIHIKPNENDVAKKIVTFEKKQNKNNLDFAKLNEIKLNKIKEIIEVK